MTFPIKKLCGIDQNTSSSINVTKKNHVTHVLSNPNYYKKEKKSLEVAQQQRIPRHSSKVGSKQGSVKSQLISGAGHKKN